MDCDDQSEVVKCNHNPNTLTTNVTDVPNLAELLGIDVNRVGNHRLDIGKRHPELTNPVLRMAGKTHP